ncbi:type II secretion system GspH family protein [Oxalobacteraceae bacterium OTU3CINTB1]|nr:type II secretion system GspH family protein [Oxalobacteraceae bacterium OTU3CINTB1]
MSIKRQRGLTIIELVMFMVIMGVAAAGIIGVINIGTKSSADPLRRKQAMLIAEAYMEEVQSAGLTFCAPADANYGTAVAQAGCATAAGAAGFGQRPGGALRPYASVADYVTTPGVERRAFAGADGVDRDVNGRALGQDQNLNTMGNSSLGPITTTVEINVLGPAGSPNGNGALGPNGRNIVSTANNLQVLKITIRTTYGPGETIQLDGYRTRYAPTL